MPGSAGPAAGYRSTMLEPEHCRWKTKRTENRSPFTCWVLVVSDIIVCQEALPWAQQCFFYHGPDAEEYKKPKWWCDWCSDADFDCDCPCIPSSSYLRLLRSPQPWLFRRERVQIIVNPSSLPLAKLLNSNFAIGRWVGQQSVMFKPKIRKVNLWRKGLGN